MWGSMHDGVMVNNQPLYEPTIEVPKLASEAFYFNACPLMHFTPSRGIFKSE